MDTHTHPASETVTLFALETSANGTVTDEQQRVEQLAAQLGLGNMWGNFGAALSPVLLSTIQKRTESWDVPFLICGVFFCLASAAGLMIDATRPLEPSPDGRSEELAHH